MEYRKLARFAVKAHVGQVGRIFWGGDLDGPR